MQVSLFLYLLLFLLSCSTRAQNASSSNTGNVPAFPGAEGFGKFTTGGRGGRIYIVTNLNDDGPGTLREAIRAKEKRTIVFEVSGTIALESPLDINYGDVTIAGQSAPGEGICIRNYPVKIGADNIIVRYIRFRLGDEKGVEGDAFYGIRHKDIIIDHCSMSWATDECASFYDNENFTMQWCIISESLNASIHEKGDHGYGGIWGGKGASFHHNLLANHTSRNPRFCGSRYHKQPDKEVVDFFNNVIYNWKHNSAYGGERGNHNIVSNYYKPGPATLEKRTDRLLNPWQPYGKFYVGGNYIEGNTAVTGNNWKGGVQCDHLDSAYAGKPFNTPSHNAQTATDAYTQVIQFAGVSHKRDAVDTRIIQEVKDGTATYGQDGIINSQKDVGGWPELKSSTAAKDTDRDGIPDEWERKNKLDPNNPADGSQINSANQYTWLENYLNSLVMK
jgi:hypothetical protein